MIAAMPQAILKAFTRDSAARVVDLDGGELGRTAIEPIECSQGAVNRAVLRAIRELRSARKKHPTEDLSFACEVMRSRPEDAERISLWLSGIALPGHLRFFSTWPGNPPGVYPILDSDGSTTGNLIFYVLSPGVETLRVWAA